MPVPRPPFPSFTLALSAESSQSGSKAPSTATLDNAESRQPKRDLMKTYDPRLDADNWNMRTMDTEEKSETDTIFEDCDDDGKDYDAISGRMVDVRDDRLRLEKQGSRRRCTRGLVKLLRTLTCSGENVSSLS